MSRLGGVRLEHACDKLRLRWPQRGESHPEDETNTVDTAGIKSSPDPMPKAWGFCYGKKTDARRIKVIAALEPSLLRLRGAFCV